MPQTSPIHAKKSAILHIEKVLSRGEKLVVAVGSKTWAHSLIQYLFHDPVGPCLKIRYAYYHGKIPDDELKVALHVDATWLALDLLVFTPTITVISDVHDSGFNEYIIL